MLIWGKVKYWTDRGFGFVRQDVPRRPDVFLHRDVLNASGLGDSLPEGTAVKLEAEEDIHGRGIRAVWCELL
jgi:cold shock CspA family protein